jgi:putative protein kinase ArgK-like GTPase of G3E family
MKSNDRNARRRAKHAARKAAELEQQHQMDLTSARERARVAAFAAGRVDGAKEIRDLVLHHAGQLYKTGQDEAAKAVREVYRALPAIGDAIGRIA